MLLSGKTLADNLEPVGALLLTTAVGLFIALKLFRWEKDEKVRTSSKLWLIAAMVPFLVIGAKEVRSRAGISESKILARKLARSQSYLIRNARIFIGDGKVIENGSVLVRGGKIAAIFEGAGP